jgi:hypothetical protein
VEGAFRVETDEHTASIPDITLAFTTTRVGFASRSAGTEGNHGSPKVRESRV